MFASLLPSDLNIKINGGALTGVYTCYSIIDSLLRMHLKNFSHVRKRRLPLESVAKITMSAHCTKEAT